MDTLLQSRDVSRVSLGTENQELKRQLEASKMERLTLLSELHCQKTLIIALEREFDSIKTSHENIEIEVSSQERQLEEFFEKMKKTLVDIDPLTQKLEKQQVRFKLRSLSNIVCCRE